MGKKIAFLAALAVCIAAAPLAAGGSKDAGKSAGPVLTMGSWRADDVAGWNALLGEYKKLAGVEIQFKPTNPPDYNATLRLQLESGTGPDLMFARSYDTGRPLNNGFRRRERSKGLQENFCRNARPGLPRRKIVRGPPVHVVQSIYYNRIYSRSTD